MSITLQIISIILEFLALCYPVSNFSVRFKILSLFAYVSTLIVFHRPILHLISNKNIFFIVVSILSSFGILIAIIKYKTYTEYRFDKDIRDILLLLLLAFLTAPFLLVFSHYKIDISELVFYLDQLEFSFARWHIISKYLRLSIYAFGQIVGLTLLSLNVIMAFKTVWEWDENTILSRRIFTFSFKSILIPFICFIFFTDIFILIFDKVLLII